MSENFTKNIDEDDLDLRTHEFSVEKACEEYSNSVKLTLTLINHQIDDALIKHYDGLEELSLKIAARTNFLEKHPTFLSCLTYHSKIVKTEPLREFDEIKITVKEHFTRIKAKIDEIENYHKKLLELVLKNSEDRKLEKELEKIQEQNVQLDSSDGTSKITRTLSFDTVTIQRDAFSEIDVSSAAANNCFSSKNSLFPNLPPNVERRKPFEDIHSRLVRQLEASDSLEGFLSLMKRRPSRRLKTRKSAELERKYTGSLWFFPKKKTTKNVASSTSQKTPKTSPKPSVACNLLIKSRASQVSNDDKTKQSKQNAERTKLKCYDILDDIDGKDLKPIKSEYPRRDNIYSEAGDKPTYLHRMLKESDKVWRRLLQPVTLKADAKRVKSKNVKKLMDYLTAPEQKFLNHRPRSLIVMPVKIIYDNFPTKDVNHVTQWGVTSLSQELSSSPKQNQPQSESSSPRTKKISPVPLQKNREMLDQLKGLKSKNDNIQKNIQKAIDVIETKMIDLLSSPEADTTNAFGAMEVEITNVLKMMNEGNTKDEAERDENTNKKTQPKKKMIFKKSTLISESPKQKEKKDEMKASADSKTQPSKITSEATKRMADIEEGERLLGQVDNVIKKIDDIYNKLNEENKSKNATANEGVFKDVHELFDIRKHVEQPYTIDLWCAMAGYGFQEAICYHQTEILYQVQMAEWRPTPTPQPPTCLNLETNKDENQVKEKKTVAIVDQLEVVKHTTKQNPIAKSEEKQTNVIKESFNLAEVANTRPTRYKENYVRYDQVLSTFYAMFFASMLVAVNFDYVS